MGTKLETFGGPSFPKFALGSGGHGPIYAVGDADDFALALGLGSFLAGGS